MLAGVQTYGYQAADTAALKEDIMENEFPPRPMGSKDDEVEGHRIYATSDRNLKVDVEPVEEGDPDSDVEGHRYYSTSDRNLKVDVEPVEDEPNQSSAGQTDERSRRL